MGTVDALIMDFPNNKHSQMRTLRQSPAQRSVRQGPELGLKELWDQS